MTESTSGRVQSPPVSAQRRALAAIARAAAPGYGYCYRCEMPWKFTENHTTWYSERRGCFPLCEPCWVVLTPEQRLPFYERLLHEWHAERQVEGGQAEAIIGAAVAGG
ncbi:MAG: hypothetical protein JWM02_3681 [Frankiales bacterium]|nr:hypothetical protein [Frankiales bacterium]